MAIKLTYEDFKSKLADIYRTISKEMYEAYLYDLLRINI